MEIQANPTPLTRLETTLVLGGNIMPLAGVWLWDWQVFEIMFLYWIENLVIGALTLVMMLVVAARSGPASLAGGVFMGAFFTVHYGMFCMGHGVFVISLFYPQASEAMAHGGLFAPIEFLRTAELWPGFLWAVAGIMLAQAGRMLHEAGTLRERDFGKIMLSPYGRIIILHVTLIFGGMLVMALDTPVAGLVFLIVLKTAFDLGLIHLLKKKKNHKKKETDETGRDLNA